MAYRDAAAAVHPGTAPSRAEVLAAWLTSGGDERIALDPRSGLNRYGCGPAPDGCDAAFGSSTASVISAEAYEAVGRRLDRLLGDPSVQGDDRSAYRAEAQQIRHQLAVLCGLPAAMAENIVLAASGTDLHLIAADLARGAGVAPLVTVMADPRESGRGVAHAVRGLRYAGCSPHGGACAEGEPAPGAIAGDLMAVPVREPDGAPRPAHAVDADFERACLAATRRGGPVLAVLLDVSKTGLIAPTPACALRLKRRLGERLTVLVDACQFRLGVQSLARYLEHGFLVALTGSKFLGGPAFAGALIVPECAARRLRRAPLAPWLGDYSGRDDWPAGFVGRGVLPDLPNLGLALRWRAALTELSAFRSLPEAEAADALTGLAEVIQTRLDLHPRFERLGAPGPRRFGRPGWDGVSTIFPFLVRHDGRVLDAARTQALYERLRSGPQPVRLGQPVAVGVRDGEPIAALRLSISARQLVQALSADGGRRALAQRALDVLDLVARRAAEVG
ncbi:MAG: hypothetical protein E7812_08405 [Phenylobacterium sp.]|nr:MAG: hypothetical protein E7812_08405 [Phenylobacterium sp.]